MCERERYWFLGDDDLMEFKRIKGKGRVKFKLIFFSSFLPSCIQQLHSSPAGNQLSLAGKKEKGATWICLLCIHTYFYVNITFFFIPFQHFSMYTTYIDITYVKGQLSCALHFGHDRRSYDSLLLYKESHRCGFKNHTPNNRYQPTPDTINYYYYYLRSPTSTSTIVYSKFFC